MESLRERRAVPRALGLGPPPLGLRAGMGMRQRHFLASPQEPAITLGGVS